jgi:hypothetical protein
MERDQRLRRKDSLPGSCMRTLTLDAATAALPVQAWAAVGTPLVQALHPLPHRILAPVEEPASRAEGAVLRSSRRSVAAVDRHHFRVGCSYGAAACSESRSLPTKIFQGSML